MSCCPTCPEDFKVKNIPDEVECLIAKKLDANDGALNLNTQINFLELFNQNPDRIIDEGANPVGSTTLSAVQPLGLILSRNNNGRNGLILINRDI